MVRVVGICRMVVVVLFQLNTYFALKYKSELSKNFVSLIVIENQKRKSNGVARTLLVVAGGVSFGSFWYEWVLWLLGARENCSLAI